MGIGTMVATAANNPAVRAGALVGGVAAIASFTPSLMPRPSIDQALVTGGSILGGVALGSTAYGAAAGLSAGAARLGATSGVARIAGPLALAAVGGATMLAARPRDDESLGRSIVRTAGTLTLLGAGAAAAVTASTAARRMIAKVPAGGIIGPALVGAAVLGLGAAALAANAEKAGRAHGGDPDATSSLKPLGIGLAVAGVIGGAIALKNAGAGAIGRGLASRLPGSPGAWNVAGNVAILGAIGGLGAFGVRTVFERFDTGNQTIEKGYSTPPMLSTVSSGPGSALEFDDLGKQGRRFVSEVTTAASIEEVTGEPAVDPVRVYVGLPAAGSVDERVDLAMAELERTGAFERDVVVFASPSGTGFVNPIPIAAAEYMARGDIATVAMQYGSRPSVMSADRVRPGAEQNEALLRAIHARLQQVPEADRPRLVMYGESLGAHTTQDVFLHAGTDGLEEFGIDRALWSGSPFRSEWRQQVLGEQRPDVDRSLVGEFNSIEDMQQRPDADNDRLKVVLLTHDNDPVAKFGVDMLVQRPDWLGDKRPETVPDDMTWMPGVSFLQSLFDAKNAATVVPGRFEANGHDYRADLAPFVREAYRFDHVEDAELGRIVDRLIADEVARSERLAG